jgi:hypothetical protein
MRAVWDAVRDGWDTARKVWDTVRAVWRVAWLHMFEPPWAGSESGLGRRIHWVVWLLGWAWVIAGLVIGALVAPSFAQLLDLAHIAQLIGVAHTDYQAAFDIGFTVLVGFIVQLIGWALVATDMVMLDEGIMPLLPERIRQALEDDQPLRASHTPENTENTGLGFSTKEKLWTLVLLLGFLGFSLVTLLVPFGIVGVSFGVYVILVGRAQARVTTALVGGLLIKTFLIPLIQNIITGNIMAGIMKWLRGGKTTEPSERS